MVNFKDLSRPLSYFSVLFEADLYLLKRDVPELLFQRGIIIGLYYFSLKQVNNGKCITVVRGSLRYTPV